MEFSLPQTEWECMKCGCNWIEDYDEDDVPFCPECGSTNVIGTKTNLKGDK